LVIALLLYNKLGIDEIMQQKRTHAVLEVLNELKKTKFVFEATDSSYYRINMKWIDRNFFEEKYYDKLLFSGNYYKGMEKLTYLMDDLFLPKKIAEKYNNIRLITMTNLSLDKQQGYTKVDIEGFKDINNEKYGILNDKEMNLVDFINYIIDIRTEAENWIKQNSNLDFDLNY
jgi:hypothetical protein